MSQLDDCWNGDHELRTISNIEDDVYDNVIKWCVYCGTVVFYTEYDSRKINVDYLVPELTKESIC